MSKAAIGTSMQREGHRDAMFASLDEWIQQEAIPFAADSSERFNLAVDKMMDSIQGSVKLLGLGEPLHGSEAILELRNRLFQRLVEAHGYCAIALESSYTKGHLANAYVTGSGPDSSETVQESGFSHHFGQMQANRQLVAWMRRYNADPSHPVKVHFYGFDSPTEMDGTDSPRQVLRFVVDYLESLGMTSIQQYRQRIETLIGDDAHWENPAAIMDPGQAVGLSPEAMQLRIETEELISELHLRRPEWTAKSSRVRFREALQMASVARQLLNYHAALARATDDRFDRLSQIRDTMMADILAGILSCERDRGKVLAFAHNSHLKRGTAKWQLGADLHTWWPAGSHLHEIYGQHYVVIGTAVGTSESQGIGQPEPGTLEAYLTTSASPARFIPTHYGERLPTTVITALPERSGSAQNRSYFPLTSQSFSDFDWLCVLDSIP